MDKLTQRLARMTEGPGKTPYVNSGLVAMWDAQWYDGKIYDIDELGGVGEHDTWEGIWYDCFGNKYGNFINSGCMSHVSGDTAKECYIQVDLSGYTQCSLQSHNGVYMPMTIEIVESLDTCGVYGGTIFSFGPRGTLDDIKNPTHTTIVGFTSLDDKWWITDYRIRFQCWQNGSQINTEQFKHYVDTKYKTIVTYGNSGLSELYFNGNTKKNYNNNNSGLEKCDSLGDKFNLLGIGGYKGTTKQAIKKIHCIRFYSTPLTSKEIEHNFKIDQQRFYS